MKKEIVLNEEAVETTPNLNLRQAALSKLRIKRNKTTTKQKLLAHSTHHPKIIKIKGKFPKGKANSTLKKSQNGNKPISTSKGTNMNRCKVRRNPYTIYCPTKKQQFYQKLNRQYNNKIQQNHPQPQQKQSQQQPQNKQKQSPKTPPQNTNQSISTIQPQTTPNTRSRQRKAIEKEVLFQEEIQVREYLQEDCVQVFLLSVPFKEEVNQEENKLDC